MEELPKQEIRLFLLIYECCVACTKKSSSVLFNISKYIYTKDDDLKRTTISTVGKLVPNWKEFDYIIVICSTKRFFQKKKKKIK